MAPKHIKLATPLRRLRRAAITPLITVYARFVQEGSVGGFLMLVTMVLAMAWANSQWSTSYNSFWHLQLGPILGDFSWLKSLHFWVSDGLMTIFFLLVGLEIKRELLVGELSSPKQSLLPIMGALGGMLLPAGIYILLNPPGSPGQTGWGIPMATDIAFSLAALSVLGSAVPTSLKLFLTALAIVDDLGAVLVIALFYTAELDWIRLGIAFGLVLLLFLLNRKQVRSLAIYSILGFLLWLSLVDSGLHCTLAGILLAIFIPSKVDFNRDGQPDVDCPANQTEHLISPWVNFMVLPLFAFANAGITVLQGDMSTTVSVLLKSLTEAIPLGILLGLMVGKPLGVSLFAWLALKLKWADLPPNSTFVLLVAVSCFAGIGFTMSLFVANLGLQQLEQLNEAKLAILIGSICSAGIGLLWLKQLTQPQKTQP